MATTTYKGPKHTGGEQAKWGAGIFVIFVTALLPVVWIVSLSLKDPTTLADGKLIPHKWSWANYSLIFHYSTGFMAALRNSIGITVITTFISVLLATMAAYAIARLTFPGKRLLVGTSLAIAMFPQISLVSPLFNVWRTLHLFDTWYGLIIPYLAFSLPLAIYILSAFFREIPWELEQAAAIDGATPLQAFTKVIAPLAAPAVFTTAILVFVFAWNDFLLAISLTSTTRARTVPAALAFFTGASQFTAPTGAIAAASVVVTIPIVIMVLLFQRRIVAGLTQGAVKG
jgi:multiple sugar transport system permease protein